MINGTTNVVAGAAVATPIWLPWLTSVSQVAALLLPIAGLTWLVIQMTNYFLTKDKK